MSVSVNKDVVKDLIEFRLRHVQDIIDEILNNWNETQIEVFLTKAKKGELPESEMDAITLEQLVSDLEKYQTLLSTFD